jgi:hypothetical protein
MKYILSILITLFTVQAIAQPTPTYTGSYTQMSYNRGSVGALRLQYIPRGFYPFPTFDTLGTIWVDSAMTRGLFYHNGTVRLRLASVPYVDSVAASIEAGSVDSSIYSTVTRLADSLHNLRDYVDSNNTIIYGAITDLYENKADKDTLNNFVLKTYLDSTLNNYVDTSLLNDSLALKQNYSDTTTWDATRYWVSTQIPSLAGYVPYTGATTDVDLGTHTISARTGVINKPSGSGIALSVTKGGNGEALTVTKTSGSGNAMSVTGGVTQLQELHTTTKIADAYISSAATWNAKYGTTDTGRGTTNIVTGGSLNKVRDSLAALNTGGTVTSIQLVAGTGVTITPTIAATTVGVFTISATGGGGGGSPTTATNPQILYKSGTDTLKGATNVIIDSTDGRLVFPYNNDTSQVGKSYIGGTKMYVKNTTAMSEVSIVDTTSIPSALQRSLNAQLYSEATPNVQVAGTLTQTGAFFSSSTSLRTMRGTYTLAPQTYNATNTQSNYARAVLSTSAAANQSVLIRTGGLTVTPVGIICNTSQYGRGGGRGTLTFSLPAYNAGEFLFYGYTTFVADIVSTPSTLFSSLLAGVGLGKDDVDTELQFMYFSTFPAGVQKVSTGITPNSEDVYRFTVYISPVSEYYLQLEVINNNSPTVTKVFKVNAANPNKPNQPKLVPMLMVGNLSTGVSVSVGLIKMTEEIY